MNVPARVSKGKAYGHNVSARKIMALDQLIVPDREPTRGIIPIDKLTNRLPVKINKGPDFRNTLSIQLFINDDFEEPANFIGLPLDLASFDLTDPTLVDFELYYEIADFPPAGTNVTVSLNYFLFDTASEAAEAAALPVSVRFDQEAAGGDELPPIVFTDAQLAGITASDLDANGRLNVLIDPYYLSEVDDVVELWLGTGADEATGNYLTPTFPLTVQGAVIPVYFERQHLDNAGDAMKLYFGYRSTDLAGNQTGLSSLVGLDVFINLPTLEAPVVPEALDFDPDGLVTFNDANPSVTVEIPRYPGAALEDEITVIWGGIKFAAYPLIQADLDRDPLLPVAYIEVLFDVVERAGSSNDIKVSYEMLRTGNPVLPSPETIVAVDLSTPGGPDPDPELPEHTNLQAPSIQCGASPANTIEPADFGKPATATVFRVGVDLQPIWQLDDVIQMHWGSVSNPQIGTVTVNATNTGANIPVPIPFADVIEAVGVGDIVTYFTLTRKLLTPGGNEVEVTVKSPEQIVKVTSAGALPGDGNQLAAGDFWEKNASNIITQRVGVRGTSVRINLAGVSNISLALNPKISYNFVGIESGDATGPGTPPGDEIEPSRINEDDVPLVQADIDRGYFEIPLPYAKTYFICRNGAKLNYSLANDLGRNSNHAEAFVRFAMNDAGSVCPVPRLAKPSGSKGTSGIKPRAKITGVPSTPPAIAFTDAQRTGITEEDLETNVLIVAVNPYFEMAKGHTLVPWVGTSQAESSGSYLEPSSAVTEPGTTTLIGFARDALLALGNNQRLYFGYKIIVSDEEESGLSRSVGIQVDLDQK
ncbi:hypothetical protein [Pseudomonas sp. PSKL.D1]|uniref:hypothetical protein n=1 Tax=Pseudomonas sp. PSKL.D1 TaxID=3029060 RepID=UPI00238166BB|nr:hypothetical protein [Pseudomonas sp. PSKL.D1]WDY57217.1 hypothetical protein PVV54_21975 [Pseudomonas sp. PSKL.D1]